MLGEMVDGRCMGLVFSASHCWDKMKSSPKTTIRESSCAESEHSAFATISGPIPEGSPRVIPILADRPIAVVFDDEREVMSLGLRGPELDAAARDHKHLHAQLASVTLITGAL